MKMTASARLADRARLVDLETRITDTERDLSHLKSEKRHTQARLDTYKYPVLTLPNEIVSEIFTQFLPPYPLCPPLTGRHSPIVFTQICRMWKEIALVTPALWRSITLPFRVRGSEDKTKFLTAWLARSRSLPLSIQMDTPSRNIPPEDWELFIPYRLRWEFLNVCTRELLHSDLRVLESPMPQLCQLELSTSRLTSRPVVIQQAPKLRAVTLDLLASSCITLPCAQLTSLTLTCLRAKKCRSILQNSPGLVHCNINLMSFDDDTDSEEQMNLPFLESLVLTKLREHGAPAKRLLKTFITPALRTLQIPDDFLAPDTVFALTSFFKSSGSRLQNACITGKRSLSRASYRAAFPSIAFSFKRRLLNGSTVAVPDDVSDVESDNKTDEEESVQEDSDEDD
ncbi:hypothetical protein C8R43DRAFT_108380 [Mycena crocata]|nr:hypothetical protein C8R43DRAFT_108380 [Mycena crocata]